MYTKTLGSPQWPNGPNGCHKAFKGSTGGTFKDVLKRMLFIPDDMVGILWKQPAPLVEAQPVFRHMRESALGLYSYYTCRLFFSNYRDVFANPDPRRIHLRFDELSGVTNYVRLENLVPSLIQEFRKADIPFSLPQIRQLRRQRSENSSGHRDYRSYYDDQSASWVAQRDRVLIDRFRYTFDP